MKIAILNVEGKKIGEIRLPKQFEEPVRQDLIKRGVKALQTNKRQSYGASPEAGKRSSVRISKKRRDYRGSYGHGISRVSRKIMSRRGTRFNWTGAFAPGTVGGRRAHPPKSEKKWNEKINKKEKRKAIRSALAATVIKELVGRKHILPKQYPLAIEDKFQTMAKTKDVINILKNIGLEEELMRVQRKKIRAGKAKVRGRKYRIGRGPLIIVSEKCKLLDAAKNIIGLEIAKPNELNTELLAPGAIPGRLTIFTESAIGELEKEGLFI